MKKCVNGRVVDMTDREAEAMRQAWEAHSWELTQEQRLEKLEKAMQGLEAVLEKLSGLLGIQV